MKQPILHVPPFHLQADFLVIRGPFVQWLSKLPVAANAILCVSVDDVVPTVDWLDRDGVTLLKCFAGCDQEAVIDALRDRGLWGGEPARTG